jgi:hypothetical protein
MAQRGKRSKASKSSKSSGGGTLSGFRSGFRNVVGSGRGAKKKESTTTKVINYLLIIALLAFLSFRLAQYLKWI